MYSLFIFILILILLIFFLYYHYFVQIESFCSGIQENGLLCITNNQQYGICDINSKCLSFRENGIINNVYDTNSVGATGATGNIQLDDTCISNQNFDKLCKSINNNFGVESIESCGPNTNKSKVKCSIGHIGQRDFGNGNSVQTTPCLDDYLDFDDMCRLYQSNNLPTGYNINSIGAKYILNGALGDCYLENGMSNTKKSRAICTYNNFDTLPKLNRVNDNIFYNKFTDCKPLHSSFVGECKKVLNTENDVLAIDISGYDCNPGFGRAKCIYSDDNALLGDNNDIVSSYFKESSTTTNNSCNC